MNTMNKQTFKTLAAALLCVLFVRCSTPCDVKVYTHEEHPGIYFFEYDGALHSSVPTQITPMHAYPSMPALAMDSSGLQLIDLPLPSLRTNHHLPKKAGGFDTLMFTTYTECKHWACDVELLATDSMELNCTWPEMAEGHYRFSLTDAEHQLLQFVVNSVREGNIVLTHPAENLSCYTHSYLIIDTLRQWVVWPQMDVPEVVNINHQILQTIVSNHLTPANRLGPIDTNLHNRFVHAGIPQLATPPPPPYGE